MRAAAVLALAAAGAESLVYSHFKFETAILPNRYVLWDDGPAANAPVSIRTGIDTVESRCPAALQAMALGDRVIQRSRAPPMGVPASGPWAFAVWVRPVVIMSRRALIRLGSQEELHGVALHIGTSLYPRILHGDEYTRASEKVGMSEWTHLAVIYNGTALTLYYNGAEVTHAVPSGPIELNRKLPITFGGESDGTKSDGIVDLDDAVFTSGATTIDELIQMDVCSILTLPPTSAPATPAPPTPAPPSPSPPTPAPPTPAPPSPSPPTPAPPTPAPPTSAPPTPAPPSPSPPTPPPPTSVPQTAAPRTPAPPSPSPPTQSPLTSAPSTPGPPTLVSPSSGPPTPWPLSPVPPTPAPPSPSAAPAFPKPRTEAPPSPGPPTPAPRTAGPASVTPPTPAPATLGPPAPAATLVPLPPPPSTPPAALETAPPQTQAPTLLGSPVPLRNGTEGQAARSVVGIMYMGEVLQPAGVGAGVAAVISAFSGSAVGEALYLTVLVDVCDPAQHGLTTAQSRFVNPTQWVVLGDPGVGMALGNAALVAAAACAGHAVVYAAQWLKPWVPRVETMHPADYRFSVGLVALRLLYTGMALGGAQAMLLCENYAVFVAGVAAVLACIAAPMFVGSAVDRLVKRDALLYVHDPRSAGRRCQQRVYGPGEWVSTESGRRTADKYSPVVMDFRPAACWFASFEQLTLLAVCAVRAVQFTAEDYDACGFVKLASGGIIFMSGLTVWLVRPALLIHGHALSLAALLTQGAAMFAMAVGYYMHDMAHPAFGVGAALILVSSCILLVKAVVLGAVLMWKLLKHRQDRLQRDVFRVVHDAAADYARVEGDDKGKALRRTPSMALLRGAVHARLSLAEASSPASPARVSSEVESAEGSVLAVPLFHPRGHHQEAPSATATPRWSPDAGGTPRGRGGRPSRSRRYSQASDVSFESVATPPGRGSGRPSRSRQYSHISDVPSEPPRPGPRRSLPTGDCDDLIERAASAVHDGGSMTPNAAAARRKRRLSLGSVPPEGSDCSVGTLVDGDRSVVATPRGRGGGRRCSHASDGAPRRGSTPTGDCEDVVERAASALPVLVVDRGDPAPAQIPASAPPRRKRRLSGVGPDWGDSSMGTLVSAATPLSTLEGGAPRQRRWSAAPNLDVAVLAEGAGRRSPRRGSAADVDVPPVSPQHLCVDGGNAAAQNAGLPRRRRRGSTIHGGNGGL
eukprot:TRINITY_DN8479_c0_g3_i2.p1 TRINITY_DN8479_c0_g3~~TRINITY_DN8479_c0_g3_i2.p1  ORF type:complete len:1200 (+),score=200.49 TRINITY_DN8479_c0_g3_i2:80-3679(+)